jgi:alginate O-acetyltransferase complex protein AlgI
LDWIEDKPDFLKHVYTLLIVIVGWVFFEFENINLGLLFIKTMFGFGGGGFIDGNAIYYLYTNGLLFAILILASTPKLKSAFNSIKLKLKDNGNIIIPIGYMVLIFLCTAYLVNETYNPFLYFRF